jgi:hypothetical protein
LATSNKNFKVKNGLDVGGAATATSFVKDGGAANQFLKADGSISNGGSAQVSATPPSYPASGDLWYNSETGQTFVYYDSYWVENVSGIAGPSGVISVTGPITNSGSSTSANIGFDETGFAKLAGATFTGVVTTSNGITNAQQKNALIASGYNSASGAFAQTSRVVMTATASGSTAPTTRPDGTSLVAGDVWISF